MTCKTIAKISAVVITLAMVTVLRSKIGIGEGAMTLAGIEPIQISFFLSILCKLSKR